MLFQVFSRIIVIFSLFDFFADNSYFFAVRFFREYMACCLILRTYSIRDCFDFSADNSYFSVNNFFVDNCLFFRGSIFSAKSWRVALFYEFAVFVIFGFFREFMTFFALHVF